MELSQTSPLKREHVGQVVQLIDAATAYRSCEPTLAQRLSHRAQLTGALKTGVMCAGIAAAVMAASLAVYHGI